MTTDDKIIIEVMFKRHDCPICFYMDEAVLDILPQFKDRVEYHRVDITQSPGKDRFLELSVSLFGQEGVYRKLCLAPVPSLFINGDLFFEQIPPRPLLEEAIETVIAKTTVQ